MISVTRAMQRERRTFKRVRQTNWRKFVNEDVLILFYEVDYSQDDLKWTERRMSVYEGNSDNPSVSIVLRHEDEN
jgi:hypothetical protein